MTSTRGVTRTGSILDKIVEDRRPVVARQRQDEPEGALRERFAELTERFGLTKSVTSPRGNAPRDEAVQIVAEIKKASPSKGVLAKTLDVEAIARAYTLGGAAGISVLTEPNYFLGSLEHLLAVRGLLEREFPGLRPSLLRKDFLIEPYELVQARAYGADNVLLIVAMLDDALLVDLLQGSRQLGL